MASSDLLAPGTILSERYEISKKLGKGGMGNVYLAKDTRLSGAPRAVKQMVVEFVDQEQYTKAIEDFRREADVLARLDHPAIPTIYDYFVEAGYYYLVMKCVSGKDLEQILEESQGPVDEIMVTRWSIQLCDVLKYIHSLNPPIIYRDMKPPNIMYDETLDRLHLIDFGIARFVHDSQQKVTAIGTMGYAPPELFMGKVVPQTDIYSLGATMFNLLTGEKPQSHPVFGFNFANNPRPYHYNPKLTKGIDEIIGKAVEAKVQDRYANAGVMKKALEEHLYQLEHSGMGVSVGATASAPVTVNSLNALLKVLSSNTQKLGQFALNKEMLTVGRLDVNTGLSPEIDLHEYDVSGKISRKHAQIVWENGSFYFVDLGSSNGSLYNGERVNSQERKQLKMGDQLCIGETLLEYVQG